VIELDDGAYLRIHLGMNGRFRLYSRTEGDAALARMSPGRVSLAITIAQHVLVWLTAPTVEIAHRRSPRHGMAIASLGTDILADDFDPARAAHAAATDPRAIGEVVLDQRIAAGIGNVYKCEALFAAGVDPRTPVARVDRRALEAIYAAARRLMASSLEAPRDALVGTPVRGRSVYGRTGKPCLRCGSTIACYSLGDPPRWTWSCPVCQPVTELSRR
jgi:endonuclease-8